MIGRTNNNKKQKQKTSEIQMVEDYSLKKITQEKNKKTI